MTNNNFNINILIGTICTLYMLNSITTTYSIWQLSKKINYLEEELEELKDDIYEE